ncbi:MAG: peptidylprolyl isomerase [Ignavibacteria bacterium]|nr:MAG: peptidylprolyl isomerase [Ignavibacteria bacterium]
MKKLSVLLLAMLLLTACGKKEEKAKSEVKGNNNIEAQVKDLMDTNNSEMLVATIKTNMGTMELELFPHETPKTVENFVGLALKHYYDGVTFHRIIDNFMIQGGDPTGTGRGGESFWGGKFQDEIRANLMFDQPGLLAMANAGPNTNGSQFFITLVPTTWLNGRHTIFGKIISGMDVLKSIGKVKTGPMDKPINPVVMESVTVAKRHR